MGKFMRLKKAVVVQCRLGSTRLKNKALKEIDEKTILEYVLNSMKNVDAALYYVLTDFASVSKLKTIVEKVLHTNIEIIYALNEYDKILVDVPFLFGKDFKKCTDNIRSQINIIHTCSAKKSAPNNNTSNEVYSAEQKLKQLENELDIIISRYINFSNYVKKRF